MFRKTKAYQVLQKTRNLSADKAWLFAVNQAVLDEIVRLNTEDQMEEQGINSAGELIGEYSLLTKLIKQQKGQRSDHITLRDTGDFYDSIEAKVDARGIEITGDPIKDDTNLFEEYGENILGLTVENLQYIIEEIKEGYIRYAYSQMGLD